MALTEPIYLVLHARGKYDNFYPLSSTGYFLSEKDAWDWCEQQAEQDYLEWKEWRWKTYHREMEDYLYPELVKQDDEHKLLVSIFGASVTEGPNPPLTSKRDYEDYEEPSIYRVQELKSHAVLTGDEDDV